MKKTNKKNKKGTMKVNTKVVKNVATVGLMTVVGGAVAGSTIRNVQDFTVLVKKAKAKHAERKEKKAAKKASKEA